MLVTIFVLPSNIGRTSKELKTLKWWQVINRFDPFGVVVLLGAITSLILALQWGGAVYPWNSPRVIAVFIVFGVLMIIWTILQWYQGDEATMPFSIITQRTVWSSVCYTLLLGASFGVLVAYLPIWFQSVVGDDAETSGLKNLPLVVSVTIGVMVAGGLVVATGYYIPFLYMGTILGSVGAGLLYTIDRDTSLAKL
jgi:MFS family permease